MTGLSSYGIYVPRYRLPRAELGKAWGTDAMSGERAVANGDEDSLTMAVGASQECLVGIDRSRVDRVYFATTTSPYAERQASSIIAAALDLGEDVATADFTGSLRAGTIALRSALDSVESGSARNVLVVAADCRPAEPSTVWEQVIGDGAGALLVSAEAPTVIRGWSTAEDSLIGAWRRTKDPYVRSFQPKVENEYGFLETIVRAANSALNNVGAEVQEMARAVIAAPDARSHAVAARRLGCQASQLQDTFFEQVGNTGAALTLMMVAAALEAARAGERLLVVSYGAGADAFILDVLQEVQRPSGRQPVSEQLAAGCLLHSYETYAAFRQLVNCERWIPSSSPVTYWRDRKMELSFRGARCHECGEIQFPIDRICSRCRAKDRLDEVPLAHRGSIFTYTLDHLAGGDYSNTPIPKAVVDLEGGGRVLLEITDCDPSEIRIGMPVDLTFRCLHEGGSFYNYYWKCRPAVVAALVEGRR